MPQHSAVEIANEFLTRRATSAWPQQMKIQKLAYIANGWNLAINNELLIDEAPQAWDNGPVYWSMWRHIKDYGYQGPSCELVGPFGGPPITAHLSPSEKEIIDHVWNRYGHLSASQLSDMTHEPGTPWTRAYMERGRNAELNAEEIRQHYINLAMAGRQQAMAS